MYKCLHFLIFGWKVFFFNYMHRPLLRLVYQKSNGDGQPLFDISVPVISLKLEGKAYVPLVLYNYSKCYQKHLDISTLFYSYLVVFSLYLAIEKKFNWWKFVISFISIKVDEGKGKTPIHQKWIMCLFFTNSAPLGQVGHRVAMSVCVSVCAIAKHPLPEVV